MTELPLSTKLPVHHLAACFDNVTNSYKYYWFLALLDEVKDKGHQFIPLNRLLARMIAAVWYPTNYFYLSFGKQDRLAQIALTLKAETDLAIASKYDEVVQSVLDQLSIDTPLKQNIVSLGRFVPYRFLRPFFANELRGEKDHRVDNRIAELAEQAVTDADHLCLYHFVDTPTAGIELQKDWFDYLKQHMTILEGFCLWHLLTYLQKNNPNVPNLASKLFEPMQRDLKRAKTFWRLVFDHVGSIQCVYSNQIMQKDDFSLDHFLPWRFVTHDLLWNIIPTPKSVNSAKSDNLPNLHRYFDRFAHLQYEAYQAIADSKRSKLFEDYTLLFKEDDIVAIKSLPFELFRMTLHDTIAPQIQIAKNMGFTADWRYAA